MNVWMRDSLLALVVSPLLIACVLWPAIAGVGVLVLLAVVVGFVLGRANFVYNIKEVAPALPAQADTVDGTWREVN